MAGRIKINNMIIGFSNGVFNKKFQDKLDRYNKDVFLAPLQDNKFKAIELHCLNEEMIDLLVEKINEDKYNNFEYISLHISNLFTKDDNYSISILKRIEMVCNKFKIKNIVLHPDRVDNWNIFKNFKHLPISLENMDSDKKFGQTVEDLKPLINKYNFNLTLDLNHCFDNDPQMDLAKKFHNELADKIVEYHISGHGGKGKEHIPLFSTQQKEIIKALKLKNKPIIIESNFTDFGDEEREFNYILDNL